MEIKALIVDDEAPARSELKYLLNHIPGVDVVGEAAFGDEAIRQTVVHRPDLVFLDIQMPPSGLEIARNLTQMPSPPNIVFVTAHDQYALEAYRYHALDYLLKPVDEKRLYQTVLWIQEKKSKDKNDKHIQRIPLEKKGRFVMTEVKDIYYFYSDEEKVYTLLYNISIAFGITERKWILLKEEPGPMAKY